jgi:hypothetical protein
MKSKLLQKISYGLDQSPEVVNGQQENTEDSSVLRRGHETTPNPVHEAVDAQARKDSPSLLRYDDRRQNRLR